MNLEVFRETDEVRVIQRMQRWQRIWKIVFSLVFASLVLNLYLADRLAHWDVFAGLPKWGRSGIYILMAAAAVTNIIRAAYQISIDRTEWALRVGQSQRVQHFLFGLRQSISKPVEIKDIELYERKLDGPDLFRVGIDLGDEKLDLPWTQSKDERDALADQLALMYPETDLDAPDDEEED